MAYNRNYSPKPQSTSDNKPLYVKDQSNITLNSKGNPILQVAKPLEGELIELQKRHYDQASTSELLDRGFSEIAKTRDKLTTDNFFNLYQELFYDLPKQGKRSHTYLIEESSKYIGGYEDPKDDKINDLINQLTEIETAQIETPSEHPLFRNGTAIRSGTSLGIMQEGHLRSVSNQKNGDQPSPFTQLKKALGLKRADGKVLPDEDAWTRVTEQTWESLPKWPSGTRIDEVADWSLTLSQFKVNTSNITILKENIKTAELDQAEINFLIKELENKAPFLENTLEDNFDGTYEPDDLLPFTSQGNTQNEVRLLNTNTNSSTSIVYEIDFLFNEFATRMNNIGLAINSPTFIDIAINSAQIIDDENANQTDLTQAYEFEDSKQQLNQNLQNLSDAVTTNIGLEQYRWSKDPNRPNYNKLSWRKEAIDQEIEIPKIIAAIDQISNLNFIYTP